MGAIRPRRMSLLATTATAVTPPASGHRLVRIGNASPDYLRVYETPGDDTTYFAIASGDEAEVEVRSCAGVIAFYLYALQAGTAVLIWQ